jgi:hypothetical protein
MTDDSALDAEYSKKCVAQSLDETPAVKQVLDALNLQKHPEGVSLV